MTMTTALQLIASNVANIYHGLFLPHPSSGNAVRILLCIIERLMMTLSSGKFEKEIENYLPNIRLDYLVSLNSKCRMPRENLKSQRSHCQSFIVITQLKHLRQYPDYICCPRSAVLNIGHISTRTGPVSHISLLTGP